MLTTVARTLFTLAPWMLFCVSTDKELSQVESIFQQLSCKLQQRKCLFKQVDIIL
jgi:hypothetical protein